MNTDDDTEVIVVGAGGTSLMVGSELIRHRSSAEERAESRARVGHPVWSAGAAAASPAAQDST
jgi:hypothetical protein